VEEGNGGVALSVQQVRKDQGQVVACRRCMDSRRRATGNDEEARKPARAKVEFDERASTFQQAQASAAAAKDAHDRARRELVPSILPADAVRRSRPARALVLAPPVEGDAERPSCAADDSGRVWRPRPPRALGGLSTKGSTSQLSQPDELSSELSGSTGRPLICEMSVCVAASNAPVSCKTRETAVQPA
jgi:hypothetical protein